jgi:Flp pilus assembly CpaF family ATPase
MKKIILIVSLFVISCNSKLKETTIKTQAIDSVIQKSQHDLASATIISNKSDSVTKQTVTKVIHNIKFLNKEVEKYKQIELLLKQTVATEKIVYKIDTVYIETKKNFWGKEKTNTTIKSDSIVNEKIDTTIDH